MTTGTPRSYSTVQLIKKYSGASVIAKLISGFGGKLVAFIVVVLCFNKGFGDYMCKSSHEWYMRYQFYDDQTIQVMYAVGGLPFSMKPLIAIISDCYPLFGFKKLYYILLLSVIGCACVPLALIPNVSANLMTIARFVLTATVATSDILVEGFYSRLIADRPDLGPPMVTLVWAGIFGFSTLSTLIFAPLGNTDDGLLNGALGLMGYQWTFFISAIPSFLTVFVCLFNWMGEERCTREEAVESRANIWRQRELLLLAILSTVFALMNAGLGVLGQIVEEPLIPQIFAATALIIYGFVGKMSLRVLIGNMVLFKIIARIGVMSTSGQRQFFTNPNDIYPDGPNFSQIFYTTVLDTVGNVINVVFVMVYGIVGTNWRYRTSYIILQVMAFVVMLPSSMQYARLNLKWGISDYAFVVGEKVFAEAVSALAWMPAFLILSHICPKKVESTVFAIVASASNFALAVVLQINPLVGQKVFGINPAGQTEADIPMFKEMWKMNILCAFCQLVPLLFLFLIPNNKQNEKILDADDCVSATIGSPYQRCTGQPDRATEHYLRELQMRKDLQQQTTTDLSTDTQAKGSPSLAES